MYSKTIILNHERFIKKDIIVNMKEVKQYMDKNNIFYEEYEEIDPIFGLHFVLTRIIADDKEELESISKKLTNKFDDIELI